jgi:hypothetical protein
MSTMVSKLGYLGVDLDLGAKKRKTEFVSEKNPQTLTLIDEERWKGGGST